MGSKADKLTADGGDVVEMMAELEGVVRSAMTGAGADSACRGSLVGLILWWQASAFSFTAVSPQVLGPNRDSR